MAIIDEIMQMRTQGIPDQQIISILNERGISPREINDSLNQAQIKNAVSNDSQWEIPQIGEQDQENQQNYGGGYSSQTQEYSENTPIPNQEQQQRYQEYYPQEATYTGEYAQNTMASDADTIIEISEQVFLEKSKTMQKQIEKMEEFKTITAARVENINERLRKIENLIDRLQLAILDKVGSYNSTLEGIKKEMSMIEDSFGKFAKGHSATLRENKSKK